MTCSSAVLAPSRALAQELPADEAELLRSQTTDGKPAHLVVYTAYLDQSTKRSADITVQELRAGFSVKVAIANSDPTVAAVDSSIVLYGGAESTPVLYRPLKEGTTTISVNAPQGFETPSNATYVTTTVLK